MKAVVFDVDGTLFDSMDFWNNMARNYLLSIGIMSSEELNKDLETLTVAEGIYYLQEKYNLKKTYTQIKDGMDQLLLSYYKEDIKLKKDVIEILEILKKKNIKIAIASLTNEDLIISALNRYGISHYFQFIQTCENTNLSKDDEKFYKLLSERLNVRHDEIFYFEDSLYSMEIAKKAGLNVVAVADDCSKKDLKKIVDVADMYIKDFSTLISFLNL